MKTLYLLPALLLLALPAAARADRNPDFDDDAKPILRMQPGLLHFVETHFEVQDTGRAMYPGDDNRRPQPPFMFRAKPRGEDAPYHLMLLIQPGPVDHILKVVDMDRVHLNPPAPGGVANSPATAPAQSAPNPVPAPTPAPFNPDATPPASNQTPAPTADTPTGPIKTTPAGQSAPSNAPPLQPTNP